jgi:hypothetical protein
MKHKSRRLVIEDFHGLLHLSDDGGSSASIAAEYSDGGKVLIGSRCKDDDLASLSGVHAYVLGRGVEEAKHRKESLAEGSFESLYAKS